MVEPCAVVLAPGMEELQSSLEEQGFPVAVADSLSKPLPSLKVRETSAEDESLAVIFATSGTTGLPKAVPLTHGNLLDNSLMMFESLNLLSEGDILLNVLPNFHSFGYTVSGLMPLVKKMRQTILASFLPPVDSMRAIYASGTNVIIAVPAMLHFMIVAVGGAQAQNSNDSYRGRLNVQPTEGQRNWGRGHRGIRLTGAPVVAVNKTTKKKGGYRRPGAGAWKLLTTKPM